MDSLDIINFRKTQAVSPLMIWLSLVELTMLTGTPFINIPAINQQYVQQLLLAYKDNLKAMLLYQQDQSTPTQGLEFIKFIPFSNIQHIQAMLSQQVIDETVTRFFQTVLADAVPETLSYVGVNYFSITEEWEEDFKSYLNEKYTIFDFDKKKKHIDVMITGFVEGRDLKYFEDKTFQYVEIPLKNPNRFFGCIKFHGRITRKEVDDQLNRTNIERLMNNAEIHNVKVYMPKVSSFITNRVLCILDMPIDQELVEKYRIYQPIRFSVCEKHLSFNQHHDCTSARRLLRVKRQARNPDRKIFRPDQSFIYFVYDRITSMYLIVGYY